MSLFAIADLHLYKGIKDKPMDVFGKKWDNHMERLRENWNSVVGDNDTVLIPGDISWATYIDGALLDFAYIDALKGKKILAKGNHDYYFSTAKKLSDFLEKNNFNTISFLHNNFFVYGNIAICGTRLWDLSKTGEEDIKILKREIIRLEISLKEANDESYNEKIVMLHFPPFNKKLEVSGEVKELFTKFNVKKCLYGHLHHVTNLIEGLEDGVEYIPVMADYLDFIPKIIEA